MKLYGITTTYNVGPIIPYVMKYIKELGYDKFIVYDNESTDNTVELLKQYPFIEVRTYHTDHYNEIDRIATIQDCVLSFPINDSPVWVTVTDFDEVLYYAKQDKDTLKDYLVRLGNHGYNVCTEHMVNLIGEKDCWQYDENVFLHQQIGKCAYCPPFDWNKPILFRLDNLRHVAHTVGHHYGYFEFYNEPTKQFFNSKHLHVFHLKYAFGKEYLLKTAHDYNARKWVNLADETLEDYRQIDDVNDDYEKTLINSVGTQLYLELKMLNGDDSYEHDDELVRCHYFST